VSANGLSIGQAVTSRTELRLPEQLPSAEWLRIGKQIALVRDSSSWWVGDWLVYGQEKFPDRYREAIQSTSLDYQTLRNYAWVARRFPPARRREKLSFQHHAMVASLGQAEQQLWLERASQLGWSVRQLRAQLRSAPPGSQHGPADAILNINVLDEKRQRWLAAAERQQQDLLDWAISVMDQAADQALIGEHEHLLSATGS